MRSYQIIAKLVARHRTRGRPVLHGHVIAFEQTSTQEGTPYTDRFDMASVEAALRHVTIFIVSDIKGKEGNLERKALQLVDFRLRPDIIFNWQQIMTQVPDDRHVDEKRRPAKEQGSMKWAPFNEMCEENFPAGALNTEALQKMAREQRIKKINNTVVEDSVAASDVANVRTEAQSDAARVAAGDAGGDSHVPVSYVGVGKAPAQTVDSVLAGLERTIRAAVDSDDEADDTIANDDAAAPKPVATTAPTTATTAPTTAPPFEVQLLRSTMPINDYERGSEILYGGWSHLFPRARGFQRKRTVTKFRMRQMFLYYDNRFADDTRLMFKAANETRRHEANRGIKSKMKSDAFDKWKTHVTHPHYRRNLDEARRNPEGKMALKVIKEALNFVNFGTNKVPHSFAERSGEMTGLLSRLRDSGPASVFTTVALDDSHNAHAVALACPFTGYNEDPNGPGFKATLEQLRAPFPENRGEMNERNLQKRVSGNGIAAAVSFHHHMSVIRKHIIGVDADRKTDVPLRHRLKGIHGRPLGLDDVLETNNRNALHSHAQITGGLAPQLVADAAEFVELRPILVEAVESQFEAELPLEYHAAFLAQKELRLPSRRDAAAITPNFKDRDAYNHHANITVMNRHTHQHQATCTKGTHGRDGCRMSASWAHDCDTRFLELQRRSQEELGPDGRFHDETRVEMSDVNDDALYDTTCRVCACADYRPCNGRTPSENVIRRNLCYEAGAIAPKPFPEIQDREVNVTFHFETPDTRTIVLDIKRRCHDKTEDEAHRSVLGHQIISAANGKREEFADDAARQTCLKKILGDKEPLRKILEKPGLEPLKKRLDELINCNLQESNDLDALRGVLDCWFDPKARVLCSNGNIADFNRVMSAETGSNAVPLSLGAGIGAKATAMYQIKYMLKEADLIQVFASILIDAHEHVRAYPSTAEDSGTEQRTALHEAQRIQNGAQIELPLTTAACVNLGIASSYHTHALQYIDVWAHLHLARRITLQRTTSIDATTANTMADELEREDLTDAIATEEAQGNTNTEEAQNDTPDDDDDDDDDNVATAAQEAQADTNEDNSGDGVATSGDGFDDGIEVGDETYGGYAHVFTVRDDKSRQNEYVRYTDAETYAYRSTELDYINAREFHELFYLRSNPSDKKWLTELRSLNQNANVNNRDGDDSEVSPDNRTTAGLAGVDTIPASSYTRVHAAIVETEEQRKAGRPTYRFELREPHALWKTHVIVRSAKSKLTALAGRKPPKFDRTTERQLALWSAFNAALFMPWISHPDYPPPDMSVANWTDNYARLEDAACLYDGREPDDTTDEKDEPTKKKKIQTESVEQFETRCRGNNRAAAWGRLCKIHNLATGLDVPKDAAKLSSSYRSRMRDLWEDSTKPACPEHDDDGGGVRRSILRELKNYQKLAEQMKQAPARATRLQTAAMYQKLQCAMDAALPELPVRLSAAGAASAEATDKDLSFFRSAIDGVGDRTYSEPAARVCAKLKKALPPLERVRGTTMETRNHSALKAGASLDLFKVDDVILPNEYMPITDAEWEEKMQIWESASPALRGDPPMNPDQRAAVAAPYRVIAYRSLALARGDTPAEIASAFERANLKTVNLIVGMGGTGKSRLIMDLKKRVVQEQHGRLVITAYTGVAAAQFGSATLLSLFNIGKNPTSNNVSGEGTPFPVLERRRKKFLDECGVEIDDVAGVVIDECSFVNPIVMGHADYRARGLTGQWDLPFGGLPLLLTGDNFQKKSPGGESWYAALLEYSEMPHLFTNPLSPRYVAVRMLTDATRFELKRNMRARNDPEFIKDQIAMRDTTSDSPITKRFLESITTHNKAGDVNDIAWTFAPIGVLSHCERDHLNYVQLKRFARYFGLPLVRWRLNLEFETTVLNGAPLEELYEAEPTMWCYFVRGAPILLTETTKSVRSLVNGTPALLDDLNFGNKDTPTELTDAYAKGKYTIVTLDERPAAVIARVGGKNNKYMWHGIPLDDLSAVLVNFINDNEDHDAQLIPILVSNNKSEIDLYSSLAAHHQVRAKPETVSRKNTGSTWPF